MSGSKAGLPRLNGAPDRGDRAGDRQPCRALEPRLARAPHRHVWSLGFLRRLFASLAAHARPADLGLPGSRATGSALHAVSGCAHRRGGGDARRGVPGHRAPDHAGAAGSSDRDLPGDGGAGQPRRPALGAGSPPQPWRSPRRGGVRGPRDHDPDRPHQEPGARRPGVSRRRLAAVRRDRERAADSAVARDRLVASSGWRCWSTPSSCTCTRSSSGATRWPASDKGRDARIRRRCWRRGRRAPGPGSAR